MKSKNNGNREIAKPASIVKGMPNKPVIKHDHPSYAYYLPSKDEVHIGTVRGFKTSEAYHATLFHELIHSTGHETRLARELQPSANKEKYSREELIAECGPQLSFARSLELVNQLSRIVRLTFNIGSNS